MNNSNELLNKFFEAFLMVNESSVGYYNTKTGEIVWCGEYFDDNEKNIEEIDEYWDDYIRLPDQYELHEYDIMEDYASSYPDKDISAELMQSIRGRGAFRRFKDKCYHHGIEKEWFRFHDEAIRQKAQQWCIDNGLIDENYL